MSQFVVLCRFMSYFFIKNLLFIGLAGLFFKKKMVKTGDIIHIYLFFRKILFFINIDTAIVSVCFPVLQLKFNRLSFSAFTPPVFPPFAKQENHDNQTYDRICLPEIKDVVR